MDKLREVDWRGMVKTATQKVKKYTLNLTDLELKVEDATSAETWGPHGGTMNEIADAAYDPENYRQIMGVLARRLQERDENWRMCYKALLLLEHLLKHGPGKIVGDVQSSASVLERLTLFEYKDANLKDHGVNVRHRAKAILDLVNSPQRLREERDKAKANRTKYRGVSAQEMRSGSFAAGGGGGGGASFGRASDSFGRSSSDRYTSGTSGSLYPSTGGGSGGGGSMGGGVGGGSGTYGMSRRTESYDETEHDSHFVSKRPDAPAASGSAGAEAPGGDPVAATRARIERLKLGGGGDEGKAAEGESKKKLTDVRVNPKIAASLGLKLPTPAAPRAAQPAAAAAPPPSALDLLGGLDEPAPAAAAPAPSAAPAFDPFAAPAAPAAAGGQQGWDAFGGGAAAAAPTRAVPLDLLGGLSGPTPVPQQPAAAADPFAVLPMPAAPAAPARPTAPAAVAAGVPTALPEDMFSDLTGIGGSRQQPMGHASSHAGAGSGAAAGGWGAPMASSGFGDFAGPSGTQLQQPVAASAAPQPPTSAPDPFANLLG